MLPLNVNFISFSAPLDPGEVLSILQSPTKKIALVATAALLLIASTFLIYTYPYKTFLTSGAILASLIAYLALKTMIEIALSFLRNCNFLPTRVLTIFQYASNSMRNHFLISQFSSVASLISRIPVKYIQYTILVIKDVISEIRQEREIKVLKVANAKLKETLQSLIQKIAEQETNLRLAQDNLAASQEINERLKALLQAAQKNESRLLSALSQISSIQNSFEEQEKVFSVHESNLLALSETFEHHMKALFEKKDRVITLQNYLTATETDFANIIVRHAESAEKLSKYIQSLPASSGQTQTNPG